MNGMDDLEKLKGKTGFICEIFQLLPEEDIRSYADRSGVSVTRLKEIMARMHTVPVSGESDALFDRLLLKAFGLYRKQNPEEFRRD